MRGTTLESMGVLHLCRPNFPSLVTQHVKNMKLIEFITGFDSVRTDSLIGYCGHPSVGEKLLHVVEETRIENTTKIPDKSHHHLYFEQEHYDQVSQKKAKK